MIKLTQRQTEVLDCIRHYIETTGYPPTRADIARELGFRSANAAEEHLKALARKGAIEMIPGTSRGIRIPDLEEHEAGIPIIGRVAAGSPLLAQEHIDSHCEIAPDFFTPKADYFLRVQGLSMINAGILEGDLLAVHTTREARNGQIVVARIDEEVTVKRFQKQGSKVLLIAENDDFSPIEVDLKSQELVIEGLAVGVLRRGH
ncbi:transcriptional repressor LexA [Motiliproteus sediminis]|uniref:transcriptional repressor LexA n=1 Tax=Motiliproteus sediminis TaxID=1468178 RepID=UPI001AF00C2E|nr:transcriptional repressor LexA [Motiliproteus sediminis]